MAVNFTVVNCYYTTVTAATFTTTVKIINFTKNSSSNNRLFLFNSSIIIVVMKCFKFNNDEASIVIYFLSVVGNAKLINTSQNLRFSGKLRRVDW